MIKSGKAIRLTKGEQECLSRLAFEPVNPKTAADHDAWVDHLTQNVYNDSTPEDRLVRAILNSQRTDEN